MIITLKRTRSRGVVKIDLVDRGSGDNETHIHEGLCRIFIADEIFGLPKYADVWYWLPLMP